MPSTKVENVAAASALAAAQRRRGLAAAISSVTVFGVGIGLGAPLLSLILEARGIAASLNGLNAACTFLGVIVGPLLATRAVRWIGIRPYLLACLGVDIALFLLMKLFDTLMAWFALRIALGIVGSSIFTTTEAWINILAQDATRGRIIGLYIASLSAGFATGPLLLSLTGISGWAPFIAASIVTAVAAVPLLAVGSTGHELGRERAGNPLGFFVRAPFITAAAALFGLYEAALLSLFPVWGLRVGLDARHAAATVSAVYFGAILLQVPVGWLSDKLGRLAVIRVCAAAGLVGALSVPLLAGAVSGLFALLLLWGGLATAVYPVALSMAGERFGGPELVSVNAAIIMSYGLGALAGPVLGGIALDLWNPHGLPALFAVLFAGLLAASLAARPVAARR
jgi:MFS family permease